jgi:hypothetical protein
LCFHNDIGQLAALTPIALGENWPSDDTVVAEMIGRGPDTGKKLPHLLEVGTEQIDGVAVELTA